MEQMHRIIDQYKLKTTCTPEIFRRLIHDNIYYFEVCFLGKRILSQIRLKEPEIVVRFKPEVKDEEFGDIVEEAKRFSIAFASLYANKDSGIVSVLKEKFPDWVIIGEIYP